MCATPKGALHKVVPASGPTTLDKSKIAGGPNWISDRQVGEILAPYYFILCMRGLVPEGV